MKTLYIDCQYGIAGDMFLASLIDLGADVHYISEQLKLLHLQGYSLSCESVLKNGINAKQIDFHLVEGEENFLALQKKGEFDFAALEPKKHIHENTNNHHHSHEHHHAKEIFELIKNSSVSEYVKEKSLAIFQEIARAESKIHGVPVNEVHFHEVGALDSILDIVGVCAALESLAVKKIKSCPVAVGHGLMEMAHGLFPVPAPATLEILREKVPLSNFTIDQEMTTPTGAAFLKELVDEFQEIPSGVVSAIGYGAGKKFFQHPNVLRTMLFSTEMEEFDIAEEKILVMECQIDDMTPEALSDVMKRLIESPMTFDAYLTPVTMKKGRLGQLVTVLTKKEGKEKVNDILLKQTTTFGVRSYEVSRSILQRYFITLPYLSEEIKVKVGVLNGLPVKATPENDEVACAAKKLGKTYNEVYQTILNLGYEWLQTQGGKNEE